MEDLKINEAESFAPTEESAGETLSTAQSEALSEPISAVDESENVQKEENEAYLDVTFNHLKRALSREEAVKYAQLGLKHEKLSPLFDKLSFLASVSGVTREEYLQNKIEESRTELKKSIEEKYGSDEQTVQDMLEYTLAKRGEDFKNFLKEEQSQHEIEAERLKEGFSELCNEFPELKEKGFNGLPNEVKNSVLEGERMLYAYLLHKHNQSKIEAELRAAQEKAEENSSGSLSSATEGYTADAFLEGLFSR